MFPCVSHVQLEIAEHQFPVSVVFSWRLQSSVSMLRVMFS